MAEKYQVKDFILTWELLVSVAPVPRHPGRANWMAHEEAVARFSVTLYVCSFLNMADQS